MSLRPAFTPGSARPAPRAGAALSKLGQRCSKHLTPGLCPFVTETVHRTVSGKFTHPRGAARSGLEPTAKQNRSEQPVPLGQRVRAHGGTGAHHQRHAGRGAGGPAKTAINIQSGGLMTFLS